jgi:hypothetical protein
MSSKNRLYPHLSADEIKIWERYIASPENKFEHFDYDVRVGTPVTVPEGVPPNIATDAELLSLKRIDAIGWKDGKPTCVEIKTYAGFKALGQAIGYPILFAQQRQLKEIPNSLIITNHLLSDMAEIYNLAGINYLEI